MKIERQLKKLSEQSVPWQPEIFDLGRAVDRQKLEKLLGRKAVHTVSDDYEEQERELFGIQNPNLVYKPEFPVLFEKHREILEKKTLSSRRGRWVYFSWLSALVHVLPDSDFQTVRMARNRNLIPSEEQKRYYDAVVGIGGLSVGNSVALAIVLQGGARRIRLADYDRLALTNLNRIRSGVRELGTRKVELTARQIYEINPYARVEIFTDGLTTKNIDKFFGGPPALDVVIDELDNLAVKYLIREQAKRRKIPVVMAADNGDNGVVDIERYDLNQRTKFFHGRMGKVSYEYLRDLNKFGIGKLITKHVGAENVTERMQKSLLQMGKTIVSWPQLGGAALLNGSAAAYCVRRIVNGQSLEKNRALISLDEKLIPGYGSARESKKRIKAGKKFGKIFGL